MRSGENVIFLEVQGEQERRAMAGLVMLVVLHPL